MLTDEYVRRARAVAVVDGDTLELELDLGFRLTYRCRVRVLGVNCPEMHGEAAEAGRAAKMCTEAFVATSKQLTVRTHLEREQDSFGRVLAEVWNERGESLGAVLLATNNAAVYLK